MHRAISSEMAVPSLSGTVVRKRASFPQPLGHHHDNTAQALNHRVYTKYIISTYLELALAQNDLVIPSASLLTALHLNEMKRTEVEVKLVFLICDATAKVLSSCDQSHECVV